MAQLLRGQRFLLFGPPGDEQYPMNAEQQVKRTLPLPRAPPPSSARASLQTHVCSPNIACCSDSRWMASTPWQAN